MTAIKYCHEAIRQLEDMRFQAVYDQKAVEKLRKSIPDHRIYEDIEIESSIEKKSPFPFKFRKVTTGHTAAEKLLSTC